MTLLVTGGAGFIGTNFILYMKENYPSVRIICVDCLTYASNNFVAEHFSGCDSFRFYRTDICCRAEIYGIFEKEKPDAVVNFAAESHVDRSICGSEQFLRTNVLGTGVLLDACLKYSTKRFHQISTDEVYGDLDFDSDEPPFTESSPLNPGNPYSASKASADLLVLSYSKTHGLPVSISRSVNNYGPFQHGEKFIPTVIRSIKENKNIPIYGNGRNVRDWLYVSDHCRAVELILKKGIPGTVYNIGANNYLSNLELAKSVCDKAGAPYSLISYVKDRPGHDRRYAVDHSRLSAHTGWQPVTSFSAGIDKTLNFYLK